MPMSEPASEPASHQFHIVGISGSLRKGSYNTGLLRAAQEIAPAGVTTGSFHATL